MLKFVVVLLQILRLLHNNLLNVTFDRCCYELCHCCIIINVNLLQVLITSEVLQSCLLYFYCCRVVATLMLLQPKRNSNQKLHLKIKFCKIYLLQRQLTDFSSKTIVFTALLNVKTNNNMYYVHKHKNFICFLCIEVLSNV